MQAPESLQESSRRSQGAMDTATDKSPITLFSFGMLGSRGDVIKRLERDGTKQVWEIGPFFSGRLVAPSSELDPTSTKSYARSKAKMMSLEGQKWQSNNLPSLPNLNGRLIYFDGICISPEKPVLLSTRYAHRDDFHVSSIIIYQPDAADNYRLCLSLLRKAENNSNDGDNDNNNGRQLLSLVGGEFDQTPTSLAWQELLSPPTRKLQSRPVVFPYRSETTSCMAAVYTGIGLGYASVDAAGDLNLQTQEFSNDTDEASQLSKAYVILRGVDTTRTGDEIQGKFSLILIGDDNFWKRYDMATGGSGDVGSGVSE